MSIQEHQGELRLACRKSFHDLSCLCCFKFRELLRQEMPRQVITQAHGDHDQQPEKAGGDRELSELAAVVNVHKEENNEHGLDHSNSERYDWVENAKIDKGNSPGKASAYHQGRQDQQVKPGRRMFMLL